MTETIDKPDLEERLTTSPRDNLLIAAALAPKAVGRRLIMLHGEWDACAKPRKPRADDIDAVRKTLRPPLVLAPKHMDAWPAREAKRIADAWYSAERLRVIGRLHSLPSVRDGLEQAAAAKGVKDARAKVLSVVAWWLDHTCPACDGRRYQTIPGTARLSNRLCPVDTGCGGTGERLLPHGQDGRLIEGLMIDFIHRARQQINSLDKGYTAVQWKRHGTI